MHRSVKSGKIKNGAASSSQEKQHCSYRLHNWRCWWTKAVAKARATMRSYCKKKSVCFVGELFQWHFNSKRQDIPPDDLVRHGLELVLHLLQESLDLQHTTYMFVMETPANQRLFIQDRHFLTKCAALGLLNLRKKSAINFQEEMDKHKQGFTLVHRVSGLCTM